MTPLLTAGIWEYSNGLHINQSHPSRCCGSNSGNFSKASSETCQRWSNVISSRYHRSICLSEPRSYLQWKLTATTPFFPYSSTATWKWMGTQSANITFLLSSKWWLNDADGPVLRHIKLELWNLENCLAEKRNSQFRAILGLRPWHPQQPCAWSGPPHGRSSPTRCHTSTQPSRR